MESTVELVLSFRSPLYRVFSSINTLGTNMAMQALNTLTMSEGSAETKSVDLDDYIPADIDLIGVDPITVLPVTVPALVVSNEVAAVPSSRFIQFKCSGGKKGKSYVLSFTATLDNGDTVKGDVPLNVE